MHASRGSSGEHPLSSRVAIVTGATSGIGRQIAFGLARLGATTVVVGRGEERAARVARDISSATGNPHVDYVGVTDLAVRSEMARLAEECVERYARIHILVNNAGGYFARRDATPDGLERTFALNVLAPFVLTSKLGDRLRESAPARVVNVASAAHRGHSVPFNDLQSTTRYSGFAVYGRSKLELILLTREFSRRFAGTGVTVNAVHPGFVHSGFAKNNGGGIAIGMSILGTLFGRSVRRGAITPLFVATDRAIEGVTGEYFSNRKVTRGSDASRDPAAAQRLFTLCARLSGVNEPPLPKVPPIRPAPSENRVSPAAA